MKKLLSMFLALLCLLSPCSVKGMFPKKEGTTPENTTTFTSFETQLEKNDSDDDSEDNTPYDTPRTYKCSDGKLYLKAANASICGGWCLIGSGITLCVSGIRDKIKYNKSGWWKKTLAGLGLIVSGTVSSTAVRNAFYKKYQDHRFH